LRVELPEAREARGAKERARSGHGRHDTRAARRSTCALTRRACLLLPRTHAPRFAFAPALARLLLRPDGRVGSLRLHRRRNDDAGGSKVSDPYAVAESDTKAYVALFNRNVVPVLDTTKLVLDGGAPAKTIDLSSLVQPGDTDGYVEATAAIYDAKRSRVWLV